MRPETPFGLGVDFEASEKSSDSNDSLLSDL